MPPRWEIELSGTWTEMGAEESAFLNQLWQSGKKVGTVTLRSQEYSFDVQQMSQTNLTSKKARRIRRVDELPKPASLGIESNEEVVLAATEPATPSSPTKTLQARLCVEIWLAGDWKRMPTRDGNEILKRKEAGEMVFEFSPQGSSDSYRIDLRQMTQTNLKTSRTRTIRIVDSYNLASTRLEFQDFRDAFKLRAPEASKGVSFLTSDALLKSWPGDSPDRELLALTVKAVMKDMDLRANDKVDLTCWNHYWALERDGPSYFSSVEVNDQLKVALKKDPQVIGRMQMHFELAVSEASAAGVHGLTREGLLKACDRLVSSDQDVLEKQWARELLTQHKAGVDSMEEDEVLTYFDFLNVMLGRKRYKVCLWMYDISDGMAERWSWLLLGQSFKGIWHTGIVCEWPERSSEFWFGGSLFESQPGTTPFGTPLEKRFLGYTYKKRQEAWEYISRHCASEFTRHNYDVLTHNCNHFSDKLSMFLRNEHIPEEVLKQPDMVMETVTARALRPLLNRWLGGFDSKESRATDDGEAARMLWHSVSPGALIEFANDSGRPAVGKVTSMEYERCSVIVLDLLEQQSLELFVPRVCVTKMLRAGQPTAGGIREPVIGVGGFSCW
eukprot:TRINITY_DN64071_c0_g1_i1.p1 TRINITY_DN64071_c0_g1~~TRINITY_DN64071_c0_g1_i1.p1  ORF type:complete len:613 (-),score=134.08 TRINITY_DN64071_c0_g1_i1:25-1863(-)